MRKAVEVALAIPATPGAAADAAAVSDFTFSLPLKLWTEISILNLSKSWAYFLPEMDFECL